MSSSRIDVTPLRRAPRLPRDHLALRPQLSREQRIMRNITILAVIAFGLALWLR